jgi:predicted nucleic acid-binding protein
VKFALDSNIILYFEGVNDAVRQRTAQFLVDEIETTNLIVPMQALAECTSRLAKIPSWGRAKACEHMRAWSNRFETQDTNKVVFARALTISGRHNMQIFDSIILAAATVAGANVLLSEDMQDGFHYAGVTILNPFSANPDPLIRSMLMRSTH